VDSAVDAATYLTTLESLVDLTISPALMERIKAEAAKQFESVLDAVASLL